MADYIYITPTGVIAPDTSVILAQVQQRYKNVFGADLIVTSNTPQGVLISSDTQQDTQTIINNAALANQINPNLSGGIFLDAIGAMSGIERIGRTYTTVSGVIVTGVGLTVIPAGSQAKTAAGDLFEVINNITLDSLGNGSGDFKAVQAGAVPCAINALNNVVSAVTGWETVTNPQAGTIGTNIQSDQSYKAYRNNTLGFQGVSLAIAITSSLYATEGVRSLKYLENYNGEPMGMIIDVTGGSTLANTTWGLATIGNITVGTTPMIFFETEQETPTPNPWPVAAFTTTGNVTLSGLGTQAGGDWPSTLTGGDIILVKDNTTDSQNGLWVAAAGAWTRQAYNTAATVILGSNNGISMKKNSIYTCIDGGSNVDIAASLLENKSGGCGWNGNVTISTTEPASGQNYDVQFDRPSEVDIQIKVTTPNGNVDNIKQVILDYADGLLEGFEGFKVAADVSPFEIAGAITSVYPTYFISKVEVSYLSPTSYVTDTLPIAMNEKAKTLESLITVVVL